MWGFFSDLSPDAGGYVKKLGAVLLATFAVLSSTKALAADPSAIQERPVGGLVSVVRQSVSSHEQIQAREATDQMNWNSLVGELPRAKPSLSLAPATSGVEAILDRIPRMGLTLFAAYF